MWVGAKQVISRNKPSKSARRRVLKLGRDPWESAGENFVTEGSRQAARGTDLRSPSGAGWAPRRQKYQCSKKAGNSLSTGQF